MRLRTLILRDSPANGDKSTTRLTTGRGRSGPEVDISGITTWTLASWYETREKIALDEKASGRQHHGRGCGRRSKPGNTYNVVCQSLFDKGGNTNLLAPRERVQRCR